MGFIEFNEDTGLLVKTKVNIAQDLKTMFKTAYGQDFEIVEGTELYSLIDLLSTELAETGSAAKAIYDGYSFTSATGTPLEAMCSLAGISRRQDESDNSLRARYYTFLYRNSVGSVEALKVKLLEHTYIDSKGVINNSVQEVLIKNNNTSSAVTLGAGTLNAHSIAVVCRLNSKIDNTQAEYNNICSELSNIVENNVSLGCGVHKSINNYNIIVAAPIDIKLKISLSNTNLVSEEKEAVKKLYKDKVSDYMNNLHIGESVNRSAIYKCLFDTITELQIPDVALATCKYTKPGGTEQDLQDIVTVDAINYAYSSEITITF